MLRVVSFLPLSVGRRGRYSFAMSRMSSLSTSNELHNHSTGRWLYNDEQRELYLLVFEGPQTLLTAFTSAEHYVRQAQFDMEQLQAVACKAMQTTKCTHASKIAEGTLRPLGRNACLD